MAALYTCYQHKADVYYIKQFYPHITTNKSFQRSTFTSKMFHRIKKLSLNLKRSQFVIKCKDQVPIYLSAQCRCSPLYCCHQLMPEVFANNWNQNILLKRKKIYQLFHLYMHLKSTYSKLVESQVAQLLLPQNTLVLTCRFKLSSICYVYKKGFLFKCSPVKTIACLLFGQNDGTIKNSGFISINIFEMIVQKLDYLYQL